MDDPDEGCCHFSLSLRLGMTSFIHRRYHCSASACVMRHFGLADRSFSVKTSGGRFGHARPRSRWFGVKHSGSDRSSFIGVTLWLLRIFSTRVSAVCSILTVNRWLPKTALSAVLADRTILSQTPPKCEAASGLKNHLVGWRLRCSLIASWLRFSRHVTFLLSSNEVGSVVAVVRRWYVETILKAVEYGDEGTCIKRIGHLDMNAPCRHVKMPPAFNCTSEDRD